MDTVAEIKRAIGLLSFLQTYINNNVKASFNDVSFSIEALVKDLLNLLDDAQFVNANQFAFAFPAVDLIDYSKKIAVQVTLNASKKKIDDTIAVYTRSGYTYDHLVVLGFLKRTTKKIPNVTVVGIDYIVKKIKFASPDKIVKANDLIQSHIPMNLLTPLDDKDCLSVVLDVLDRSAIRDLTEVEGSYERMSEGIDEIKQIITTGSIKSKPIRAKALVEYGPDLKSKLGEIEFRLSTINQIVNRESQRNPGSRILFLDQNKRDTIDSLKREIVVIANLLAKQYSLGKIIRMSDH